MTKIGACSQTGNQSATRFALSVLAISVLAACGGGGGDSLDVADGGIRGTGSSVGPVSGFGSVFVNGVRFETNGEVESDDGITTEGELDEGMILRIDGEWRDDGTGKADQVEYDDTLRGPISVDVPWDDSTRTAVISIHGLIVNIDRQTVIKGGKVTDLQADDIVRVSGWRLANGEFRASLVRISAGSGETFDSDNEIELEGKISNFDGSPCSFDLGSIRVRCDNQNIQYETLTQADLEDQPVIEVEGNMLNGELDALEIRNDGQRRYNRGGDDDIEFAGPVSDNYDSASRTLSINGLTVNVTPDTEFEDGLAAQDLLEGLLIQVEGAFQNDGSVNADEIQLREANAEVEGVITGDVDAAARTFQVGGVQVQMTSLTVIIDDDDSGRTPDQSLQSLRLGDEVEVEGIEREGDNGNIFLEALKIEREEPEDDDDSPSEFELEGKVRQIDDFSITVLGVRMTAENSAFEGNDRSQVASQVNPLTGEFPIVEVGYEPIIVGLYPYRATDIELDD